MIYSLHMSRNKEVVLGDFGENFEEKKIKILAKAEKLFSAKMIFLAKEEKPFSLRRTFCDNTKWQYPIKTEYAPVDIKEEDGKISISVIGPFSTDIPKILPETQALEAG